MGPGKPKVCHLHSRVWMTGHQQNVFWLDVIVQDACSQHDVTHASIGLPLMQNLCPSFQCSAHNSNMHVVFCLTEQTFEFNCSSEAMYQLNRLSFGSYLASGSLLCTLSGLQYQGAKEYQKSIPWVAQSFAKLARASRILAAVAVGSGPSSATLSARVPPAHSSVRMCRLSCSVNASCKLVTC